MNLDFDTHSQQNASGEREAQEAATLPGGGAAGALILVVDDDRAIQVTLGGLLQRHGYSVLLAGTAAMGLASLRKETVALVLLDLGLPDAQELEAPLAFLRERPGMPLIVLTAHDSLGNAIGAIKLGAYHFMSKPYAPEELLGLIRQALEGGEGHGEGEETVVARAALPKPVFKPAPVPAPGGAMPTSGKHAPEAAPLFIGRKMKELEAAMSRFAPTQANVLLSGESGVGKEVVARRIHEMSRRAAGPMVCLNCAAFPPQMIEGELFGYTKGAFTGALNDFPGLVAEADGGTLFLDEIAEMPVELQTRFLRVLQEREYRPLGSVKTHKVDFRLISASNRSIERAVRDGLLRRDLLYRLNTFHLRIPPLRERCDEIPHLVQAFIHQFSRRLGKPAPRLMADTLLRLCAYPWPGNIRELQNSIEYAVIMAQNGVITDKELPEKHLVPENLREPAVEENDTFDLDVRERNAILAALAESHGNKRKAAELLGIHRPTLYSKMKRYDIKL